MNPNLKFLDEKRVREGIYASKNDLGATGLFQWESGHYLFKILSSGDHKENTLGGWEHVSVSKWQGKKYRMPTWEDMVFVKNLFWGENETVVQFHPKKSEYINFHPACLHLWKKVGMDHELPPSILLGPKSNASDK